MLTRSYGLLAGTAVLLIWIFAGPAQALSEQECSVKYQAAKAAGALNGMKWNDFRKSECGSDASEAAAPAAPQEPNNSSASTGSGQALSEHECSAKYKAAESAGTLNGMKWNDFRRAECGASSGASAAATTTESDDSSPPAATTEPDSDSNWTSWLQSLFPGAPSGNQSATGNAPPPSGYVGNTVFPTAISPQYANVSVGEGRELTCLDQYRANKANGGNGDLEWIEKGGGYFSECDKRLGGK